MNSRLTMLRTGTEVRSRITALAAAISADYRDICAEHPLLVLCTLRGAAFFAADLARALTVPCEVDFLKIRSYQGLRPAGAPVLELGGSIDVCGRQVLIVEDIVDTGQTMNTVLHNFADRGAADIRICTLLDKPVRRLPEYAHIVPDYIGFSVPDVFVVGWGIDYNDQYRLLPDIMAYHPE